MRREHDPDSGITPPDPWRDPYSAGHRPDADKAAGGSASPHARADADGPRRSPGRRGRTWALAVVLGAVWLGLLLDPTIGPLMLAPVAGLGIGLAFVAGAMGLGMVGTGLFAVGDRVVAWLRQGSRWPEA